MHCFNFLEKNLLITELMINGRASHLIWRHSHWSCCHFFPQMHPETDVLGVELSPLLEVETL